MQYSDADVSPPAVTRPRPAFALFRPGARVYLELVAVTAIWGGGVVANKIAGEGFAPLTASALRTAIGSLGYLPLLALAAGPRTRPRPRDLPLLVLLALFGFFLFNLLYFTGLARSTATHAALIFGANPVATGAAAALFLHERTGKLVLAGVAVSTLGVAVIIVSSGHAATAHGATVLGDLLLVGEMLSWVGFTLVSRVAMRRFSPAETTGYACMLGLLMLAPAAVAAGFRPGDLAAPWRSWVAIVYSGGVSVVLGYVLWNRSLLRLGPTRTAVFSNLTPVWGVLLAHLIEGEALVPLHAVAAVTIIGGVLVAVRGRR
jgi:drug/metabolite transporter (DMT)-like permease